MNKSNYLMNTLQNLLHSFEAEDNDDNKCRQQFRERWNRPPSQNLNYKMVQAAQQFISSLMKTKEFDQKENEDIVNNSKYYEQLMLTREKLNENIPHEEEKPEKEDSEEEKEVKTEILKLYELNDKCTNIIRPIFSKLNDDSVIITQFMEVLDKKTTEQIIFERNKDSFQSKFNELKKISDEIKKQENVINELYKKHFDKIMPKQVEKSNENKVNDYFADLYELSNKFLEKHEN